MQISVQTYIQPTRVSFKLPNCYDIDFTSAEVKGKAKLYTGKKPQDFQKNSNIAVELDFDDIQNLVVLPVSKENHYQIDALETEQAYTVVGTVRDLFDEVSGVACSGFDVTTNTARFTIVDAQILPIKVKVGDWVRFTILGLTLWDTDT